MAMSEQNWTPTIRAAHEFRADIDAQNLYDSLVGKGSGVDTRLVTEILTKRSNFQRQLIKAAYEHKYKQSLDEALNRSIKGDFSKVIDALLDPPDIYDAKMINKAFSFGTNDVLLVDILCTKNNDEIRRLQNAYRSVFGRNLVDAVHEKTSGDFRKLMVPIASAERAETEAVDKAQAQRDAKRLYQAGEKKWGTDEDTFQQIIGLQSPNQLVQLMNEYEASYKNTLDKAIDSEFSGVLRSAYFAILQCAQNHHIYFASAFRQSMKGLGTVDDRLMWLTVSRSEIDLGVVKTTFEKLCQKPLAKWVQDDTSGDYRDALLAVIKGNH